MLTPRPTRRPAARNDHWLIQDFAEVSRERRDIGCGDL